MSITATATAIIPCPVDGCLVFPYDLQSDVDEHVAMGDHLFALRTSATQSQLDIIRTPQGGQSETRKASVEAPPMGGGASEAQTRFIAKLASQLGIDMPDMDSVKSVKAASKLIDSLKDQLKDAATKAVAEGKPVPGPKPTPNKYEGNCSDCGHVVPAGEGIVRKVDGRWLVGHTSCPTSDEVAPRPTASVTVPDGFYAVSADAGQTSFYKVTAGRNPGITFVDQIIGGGHGTTLRSQHVARQSVPTILAKIAADVTEASARFAREMEHCRRCGRHLTKESSRISGLGPECSKKG